MKPFGYLYLAAMMAMPGGDAGFTPIAKETYESLSDDEKLALEKRIKEKQKNIMLKKGLREFTFDGITVLAINEKNARRKIEKIQKQ